MQKYTYNILALNMYFICLLHLKVFEKKTFCNTELIVLNFQYCGCGKLLSFFLQI